MQLTKNFSLAEMIKSETALRHDMDNTPGEQEIENLECYVSKYYNRFVMHTAKELK